MLVGVTTLLDGLFPVELELDLFYFVPIAAVGWWGSAVATAFIAVLATVGNLLAGAADGQIEVLPLAWNVPTRLAIFGGVGMLMWQLRREHDAAVALALRDQLTGLANRRLFVDRARQAFAAARRGTTCALLAVDLDGFKQVNDRYGHAAGDELLRQVAARIEESVRLGDTVARVGGDEFVVLLNRIDAYYAQVIRDRIAGAMSGTFDLRGQPSSVGASVGLALYPDDGQDVETVLAAADARMYRAKASRPKTWATGTGRGA